jgi:hypothetical protein
VKIIEKVLLEAELLDLKSNQIKRHKEPLLKHSWTKEKDIYHISLQHGTTSW